MTMAWLPRCMKMLTRNRHCPGRLYETSHEPCSRSAVNACWFPAMSSSAIRRVSSLPRGGIPVILTGTSWPLTSICGWLPGEKIRSLTRAEARNIAESKAGAGIAGLATASLSMGALVALSRIFSSAGQQLIFCVGAVSSDQGCCARGLALSCTVNPQKHLHLPLPCAGYRQLRRLAKG